MKTAFVFAGQGAQAVGMGKDLAEAFPECKELFVKADQVLGFSLSDLCFNGPIEELTKSSNCQPAIFVMSMACLKAMQKTAPALTFSGTAGLSLGEYTALHVSGVLSFEDTLKILQARGRFMQEACEERQGGMVSVLGLTLEKVQEIAKQAGVEVANLNSPTQVVLSGDKQKIAQVEPLAKAAGAKRAIVLNVAGAFHSSLMSSAASKLEGFLTGVKFEAPKTPVVANFTGAAHTTPEEIRKAMVRQVTGSVKWISCVECFKNQGVQRYVEFGPGKVLSGLITAIDAQAKAVNVSDKASLDKAAASLTA